MDLEVKNVMNINKVNRGNLLKVYKSNTNVKPEVNKTQNEKSDKLEISSVGRKLSVYRNDIRTDNTEKIEKIKEEISKGKYNVDSNLIAKKMVEGMKENKG